jgi:predicted nucleic acid-binding protein
MSRTREPVFLDTNGWLAILNDHDVQHQVAAEQWRRVIEHRRLIVTTDWIVAETGNCLARSRLRAHFPEAIRTFLAGPDTRLIRIDSDLFHHALDLYEQAGDKTWGLGDCASFAVMRSAAIGDALTSDRHFQQAGFACLLPGP